MRWSPRSNSSCAGHVPEKTVTHTYANKKREILCTMAITWLSAHGATVHVHHGNHDALIVSSILSPSLSLSDETLLAVWQVLKQCGMAPRYPNTHVRPSYMHPSSHVHDNDLYILFLKTCGIFMYYKY